MNVMLVDDYPLILRGLLKTYPWEENGFPVVAQANNGKQALSLLKESPVDILITDIRMPEMDGLALIEAVKQLYPHIKIAVLSAYDDFDQVRAAFQRGADDYILKQELNRTMVAAVLDKFKTQQLIAESEKKLTDTLPEATAITENQQQTEEQEKLLRELALQHFHAVGSTDQSQQQAAVESLLPKGKLLLLQFVVEVDESTSKAEPFFLSFEQRLKEFFDPKTHFLFRTNYNELNLLVPMKSGEEREGVAKTVYDKIKVFLEETGFPAVFTCTVSNESDGSGSLPLLYKEAKAACDFRMTGGKGNLIFYEETVFDSFNINREVREKALSFHKKLADQNFSHLLNQASPYFPSANHPVTGGKQRLELLYSHYFWALIHFIEEQNIAISCEKAYATFQFLLASGSTVELNKWFYEIIEQIAEQSARQNRYITLFRQYLETAYPNSDLRIEEIAFYLGISVGHVGKVIYKETGYHFSDYLNRFRIEKAKTLLANSTLKVYQVASLTGYSSVEHFTRVFKKLEGISPSAFSSSSPAISQFS